MKRIGYRLLCIAAVLILSVLAFYPPERKINLGLDLKGGVRLVAQVHTDDVLRLETQAAVERVRESLTMQGASFTRLEATGATELVVDGVEDAAALREATSGMEPRFDRATIGTLSTFRIKPEEAARIRQETVQQVIATIERRVNELGVVEPSIARYGTRDQVDIQLPGVTDVERAKQLIKATAQLRLTLVADRGPFASREAALDAYSGTLPPDLELLPGRPGIADSSREMYFAVHKAAAVTGKDLRGAEPSRDEYNRPAVAFTLKPEAAQRFAQITGANVDRRLATVLDDRVMSLATILGRIEDRGQIRGVTLEEMRDQVILFKSGALPASMEYIEQHTVGASLGQDSIRAGLLASVAGLGLVMTFMLGYYRLTGLNALVSIALNLAILLGLLAFIGATMTLPGIAGFVLTIGMGVDSNVLIFERIKEELAGARSARAAVNAGFSRVWLTIVDTHISSLIAAAFLFQFGTAPIRGFATTLAVGLLANVFTAVFVSRTLFEVVLSRRDTTGQTLSI
ncbi:MAG TPA: protein translocase subunit SecD [Vicinamibacterales bacterium]|nr:protein translocase subunit SecD [Vicinamibacterales bacterium]